MSYKRLSSQAGGLDKFLSLSATVVLPLRIKDFSIEIGGFPGFDGRPDSWICLVLRLSLSLSLSENITPPRERSIRVNRRKLIIVT